MVNLLMRFGTQGERQIGDLRKIVCVNYFKFYENLGHSFGIGQWQIYTRSTQGLPEVYTRSTFGLQRVYLGSTRRLPKVAETSGRAADPIQAAVSAPTHIKTHHVQEQAPPTNGAGGQAFIERLPAEMLYETELESQEQIENNCRCPSHKNLCTVQQYTREK